MNHLRKHSSIPIYHLSFGSQMSKFYIRARQIGFYLGWSGYVYFDFKAFFTYRGKMVLYGDKIQDEQSNSSSRPLKSMLGYCPFRLRNSIQHKNNIRTDLFAVDWKAKLNTFIATLRVPHSMHTEFGRSNRNRIQYLHKSTTQRLSVIL